MKSPSLLVILTLSGSLLTSSLASTENIEAGSQIAEATRRLKQDLTHSSMSFRPAVHLQSKDIEVKATSLPEDAQGIHRIQLEWQATARIWRDMPTDDHVCLGGTCVAKSMVDSHGLLHLYITEHHYFPPTTLAAQQGRLGLLGRVKAFFHPGRR